jgi:hypothetical protein
MKKPVISDSYDIKPSSKPAVKGLREWQSRGLKNGGKLPAGLQKSHSALHAHLTKSPEAFAHIPRERGITTVTEWVTIAEGMANANGGKLPVLGRSHSALQLATRKYPEAFAHIPQEGTNRSSVDQRVKEAEALHKKHGPNWVQGLSQTNRALYKTLNKHPKAFAHLKRAA